MTLARLVILHARIVKALVAAILKYLRKQRAKKLDRQQWNQMLATIYPFVEEARRESSRLAREFYDQQREKHVNDDDSSEWYVNIPQSDGEQRKFQFPVQLAPYKIQWFIEAMEPEYEKFSKEDANDKAEASFVARVEKEIRGGGRRTTLYAVQDDPKALGWARVQGGAESCAWCAMLISRGPVYKSKETASFKAHPHCDCEVMPVFDKKNWEGKDAYEAVLHAWTEHTRGYKNTKDRVNAFRRYLDRGDDTPQRIAA